MLHESELRSPVRRRTRNLKAEEILVAARDLVVTEGVEALTLHALARRLSYVPAALYRYFPSKEALVAALLGRALEEMGGEVARAVAAVSARHGGALADGVPLARVVASVEAFLGWAHARPREAALVTLGLADPRVLVPQDELARQVALSATTVVGTAVEALQDAAEVGALSDAQPAPARALMLGAGLLGTLAVQKMVRLAPGAVDVRAQAREHARVLLLGCGASSAALAHAEHMAGVSS